MHNVGNAGHGNGNYTYYGFIKDNIDDWKYVYKI